MPVSQQQLSAGKWRYRQSIERWGFRKATTAALLRRAEILSGLRISSVRFGELPLREITPVPEVPPGTELRPLTLEDVRQNLDDQDLELSISPFRFAIDHGHVPLGLFIEGRLLHYTIYGNTIAPGPDNLVVRMNPGFIYVYRTFTHPAFRGRHLVQLRTHLSQVLWSKLMGDTPYRGFVSYIDAHNLSSIATNERYGDSLIGYAGYLPVGSRFLFFRSKGAKTVGFRFDYPSEIERAMLAG